MTFPIASLVDRPGSRSLPVIAVLPPEARISDDTQAHVAWALAEHVRRRLERIPRLIVETRGTTERVWAEAGGRTDRLASSLGAALVVTGQIVGDREGARIRIRLVSRTDSSVWQGEFVYPGLDLAAIEDEIVTAVARQLRMDPPAPLRRPMRSDAYDALARGDYFLARHDSDAPDSARAAYLRALTVQPGSARLMERVARAYAVALDRGGRVGPLGRDAAIREALALIDRAVKADEALADAWTTRAMLLRARDPKQYAGAVAAHQRAVKLAPRNADAHHEFALTLLGLGRDDAARIHTQEALRIERDRAGSLATYAELEYLARRYGASCALINASIGADSYQPLAYALRARVRMKLGDFRDAFSDAETAARLGGESWGDALQFYVTAVAREPDVAQAEGRRIALSRLKKGTTMSVREAAFLGMAYAAAGDRNRAFDALSRSGAVTAELRTALRDPAFDSLRRDTRFARIGMTTPVRTSLQSSRTSAVPPGFRR